MVTLLNSFSLSDQSYGKTSSRVPVMLSTPWPTSTSSLSPPPTEYAAASFLPHPFHLSLIHLFQGICERILVYRLATDDPHFFFSSDIAQAIQDLWADRIIPALMNHLPEFYLMDNAS